MKNKPQVHYWLERIGTLERGKPGNKDYRGTTVYALNACRAWDTPANGVFLIFMWEELRIVRRNPNTGHEWFETNQECYAKVLRKLEGRERALIDWYGRDAKHHLNQFELTPAERRASNAARESQHQL